MQRGYVKVWRKIEDSGLLQLPNTLALFMHILLRASHKDKKVGTSTGIIDLKRGQFISGRIKLASVLEQSEQQIRTGLERLEELDIITITATNRYSVYTVVNYSNYQDKDVADNQQDNQQSTSSLTNKQPTDNQQITTKEELKNLSIETKYTPLAALVGEGVPTKLAKSWLSVRSKKRMPLTEEAFEATKREAAIAGMTLEQAVMKCCEKSWAGFEAKYLKDDRSSGKETIHDKRSKTAKAMFGDLDGHSRRIIDVSPDGSTSSDRPPILENGELVR